MAGSITIYTNNILEDGTVTVTGVPDTGFPEERLWDRHISLVWKVSAVQGTEIIVDQGATGNVAVDFLALDGHNWSGINTQWQYSTTGAFAGEEVDAVTDFSPPDNSLVTKVAAAPQTKRYWRLVHAALANPQASEVFMGLGYTFNVLHVIPPIVSDLDNVSWRRSVGGLERSTKSGDERKTRTYSMSLSESELTDFRTAMDDLDGYSKPFYIKDHEDVTWLARLTGVPIEVWDNLTNKSISISLIEML